MRLQVCKYHMFKTGPRLGEREICTPHKFSDGFYRVFSLEGVVGDDGKRHWSRLENGRNLATLQEVADHVEKGWGVRMTGPLTPTPSLCWKSIEVVR